MNGMENYPAMMTGNFTGTTFCVTIENRYPREKVHYAEMALINISC